MYIQIICILPLRIYPCKYCICTSIYMQVLKDNKVLLWSRGKCCLSITCNHVAFIKLDILKKVDSLISLQKGWIPIYLAKGHYNTMPCQHSLLDIEVIASLSHYASVYMNKYALHIHVYTMDVHACMHTHIFYNIYIWIRILKYINIHMNIYIYQMCVIMFIRRDILVLRHCMTQLTWQRKVEPISMHLCDIKVSRHLGIVDSLIHYIKIVRWYLKGTGEIW